MMLSLPIAFAFDPDFKTVNDRVPLEFNLLFDSMKETIHSPSEKMQLVEICKTMDDNLGLLQKENIFFLMKSEVIKNILEYKHEKVRSFDITTLLITRLEEDLENKQPLLTPFSRWIWRSIIAELKFRKSLGLISHKSFNVGNFEASKRVMAQRFFRYLNYLIPWIDKMDSLSASEFNLLVKEISWTILRRLNDRSLLFKRFASTSSTGTRTSIFNIPSKLLESKTSPKKESPNEQLHLNLKEASEKEKIQATEQIQNISPDDLSPLSEGLTKELEEKAP
jgi:hypothetical protein